MTEKKPLIHGPARTLLAALLALAVLLFFFTALNNLDAGRHEEGRRQLEQALRRSAVACYAAEGFYPPDLAYLKQHYGLRIDEKRYAVFYEVYGSNLMPDITVLMREQ